MIRKLLLAILLLLCAAQTQALNKQDIEEQYNINFGVDGIYRLQNIKSQNVSQLLITPYLNKKLSDNKYGKSDFNFSMNIVRFPHSKPTETAARNKIAVLFNGYDTDYNELYELYVSYNLPNEYNNITVGIGQIPIAKFDSPIASDLQRYYFLNSATSQNGTFIYPTAGIGAYTQAYLNPNIVLSMGFVDASNPTADGIRFNYFAENSYFASVNYVPQIYNRYQGSYSLLLYNKPNVKKSAYSGQGWSLYLAQDISDKHSLFFRLNGSTGNNITDHSYTAGLLYNDPFNRSQNDGLGLAYSINKINKKATDTKVFNRYEHIIETYYNYSINNNFSVLSDAQLYLKRGFEDKNSPAAVISLSLNLSL